MKKINFVVDGDNALVVDGIHIDLHNNYDFNGFKYDIEKCELTLSWTKSKGHWARSEIYEHVALAFVELLFLKTKMEKNETDFSKNSTLAFMGYLHPDDSDVMDGCLSEDESQPNFHILFYFENDLAIKVYSNSVQCLLF